MIFLAPNNIMMNILSEKENLLLMEIILKNEKENNLINLKTLSSIKIGDKPILHLDLYDNGDIISNSEEKVFIIHIKNKKIEVKGIFNINNDYFISLDKNLNIKINYCIMIEKVNFLLYYNIIDKDQKNIFKIDRITIKNINAPIIDCKSSNLFESGEFSIFSIEKISKTISVVIGAKDKIIKNNKKIIFLKFFEYINEQLILLNEREIDLNEKDKENIIIKKLYENYVIISEQIKGYIIYNFRDNKVLAKFECDNIISMYIQNINNKMSLYTIEIKESLKKDLNQALIKKYSIKNNSKFNTDKLFTFDNDLVNNIELPVHLSTNKIINMIVISNDNNEKTEKKKEEFELNLVFFTDDIGNIFYKYY